MQNAKYNRIKRDFLKIDFLLITERIKMTTAKIISPVNNLNKTRHIANQIARRRLKTLFEKGLYQSDKIAANAKFKP